MADLPDVGLQLDEVLIKRLDSGYTRIQGAGICNWWQGPVWPCDPGGLERGFFPEAGPAFRREVRRLARAERIQAGTITEDDE